MGNCMTIDDDTKVDNIIFEFKNVKYFYNEIRNSHIINNSLLNLFSTLDKKNRNDLIKKIIDNIPEEKIRNPVMWVSLFYFNKEILEYIFIEKKYSLTHYVSRYNEKELFLVDLVSISERFLPILLRNQNLTPMNILNLTNNDGFNILMMAIRLNKTQIIDILQNERHMKLSENQKLIINKQLNSEKRNIEYLISMNRCNHFTSSD